MGVDCECGVCGVAGKFAMALSYDSFAAICSPSLAYQLLYDTLYAICLSVTYPHSQPHIHLRVCQAVVMFQPTWRPTSQQLQSSGRQNAVPSAQTGTIVPKAYLFSHGFCTEVGVRNSEVKGDVGVHKVCVLQRASIRIIHGLSQIQVAIQEDKGHVQPAGLLVCIPCRDTATQHCLLVVTRQSLRK